MDPVVIALDLGTTGNRAIAFNASGDIVASSYYEFAQYFPHPAWVEHNPMELWASAERALTDVLTDIGNRSILCMGITNQRETTVVWDKETGLPLHNAIVWQCRRTTERCHELALHAPLIKEKTGLFLDPYFSATKLEWLLNNIPEVQDAITNKKACFGTIDSWVLYKLTEGKVHATDVSNASRTMLFNITTLTWDSDLLDLFHIPYHILPKVYDSDAYFGEAICLNRKIPIHAIIGDQQAALFAQCGRNKHHIKNTYGTGLFLVANTGTSIINTDTLISTIAWKIKGELHYALEGSVFIGGSLIQWLRDGLELIQSSQESEDHANSVPTNDDIYFVPALSGLGAPYWDPKARGTVFGLTRGTKKAHIIRAALESLAFQTKDITEEIKRHLSYPFSSLKADGGAVHNHFLMQFQSDILNLPVTIPAITEATAFGAAAIAGIKTGFWTENDIAQINTTTKTYTPTLSTTSIDSLYSKWKKAVYLARQWGEETI